jgi:hypothetical protein
LDGFDSVFGGKSSHNQCKLTVGCRLDGSPVNPLYEFSGATTATVHSYNKFDVFHGLSCFHFTYGPYQFSVSCRALQAGESCFAMTDWPSLTARHFSWSHSQLASSLL